MRIPKRFKVFGEKHKVKFVRKLDGGHSFGEWDPNTNTIKLQMSNKERSQDMVEQTFLHELVHCCLDHLGYEKLSDDEIFVDSFAKALHQAFKTSEYDK